MTPVCPFAKAARPDDVCPFSKASRADDASAKKPGENSSKQVAEQEGKMKDSPHSASVSPKCPFGYDSQTFKIGPLSCMICQALLFESSRCVPCTHAFCKYGYN